MKKAIIKNTVAFTDGSTRFNGRINARGGVGVFFNDDDPRNLSLGVIFTLNKLLPGYKINNINNKITNNLCELTAVLSALAILKSNLTKKENVTIRSDSLYTINCLTKWYKTWETNEWMTKDNKPIKNKYLIVLLVNNYIKKYPSQIIFKHIKAHGKQPPKTSDEYVDWYGNYRSDQLATLGADTEKVK